MRTTTELPSFSLPGWASEIRPHQTQALQEISEAFARGIRCVVLDAPTGSGKTLIGELTRQVVGGKSLYVCNDKGLQDQFLRDFPDSRVLKGRSNYDPVRRLKVGSEYITCDDCTGAECAYCPTSLDCPYIIARQEAMAAETAVLNSAYYLAELNGPGRFKGRELVVVDEADTLEPAMMRWVEIRVTGRRVRDLGLKIPPKGTHQRTIVNWVRNELIPELRLAAEREHNPKRQRAMYRQSAALKRFTSSWGRGDVWVRQQEKDALVMKPVEVAQFGKDAIFKHGERFLMMSATTISSDMMMEGLGWTQPHAYVSVPMTFPVENRKIIVAPVSDMSRAGKERGEWNLLPEAIRGVLRAHPEDRVLVHAVSYELTQLLYDALLNKCDRQVFAYKNTQERESAIDAYRATPGSVLIAPSLERGVDFAHDLCRVVVVAKVPYPYLGDPQVSARLNDTPNGQTWYKVETVRSLVQMTGRGVRSKDDWATSYILDKSFINVMRRSEHLFPKWWADALVTNFNPTTLLGG